MRDGLRMAGKEGNRQKRRRETNKQKMEEQNTRKGDLTKKGEILRGISREREKMRKGEGKRLIELKRR